MVQRAVWGGRSLCPQPRPCAEPHLVLAPEYGCWIPLGEKLSQGQADPSW